MNRLRFHPHVHTPAHAQLKGQSADFTQIIVMVPFSPPLVLVSPPLVLANPPLVLVSLPLVI